MSPVRSIIASSRWLTAKDVVEDVPVFTLYLENERIGDARLALRHLDTNDLRTCYLGTIETRLGELSLMVELPPTEEAASHAVRDSASAIRALDATAYGFDGGRVTATFDGVTGFWSVAVDGDDVAVGLGRDDALAVAHKQVES